VTIGTFPLLQRFLVRARLSSFAGEQRDLARAFQVGGGGDGFAEVGADGDNAVMGYEDCVSVAEAEGEI
jgi:hypothetical protein